MNSNLDIQSAARAIASQGRARTYATPIHHHSSTFAPPTLEADYAFEVSAAQLRK